MLHYALQQATHTHTIIVTHWMIGLVLYACIEHMGKMQDSMSKN